MNRLHTLTIATLWFAYLVSTTPDHKPNPYKAHPLFHRFEERIGNDISNYTGDVEASGVGAASGFATGSGPNGSATLSIGSVGTASGVTFETGSPTGTSVGSGVSGVGNAFGTGSATGFNSSVGINSSGVGNGTANHLNFVNPGLPLPPNPSPPTPAPAEPPGGPGTPLPPPFPRPLDIINRQGRQFFYNPYLYGYGGYYPYYNRHYFLGRK